MLGFVGKKEYPFDLFTTSFKVNLADGEEQRINFSQLETADLEPYPYQSQSFDHYQLKAKSIIVSKKNGIISAKLDEEYSYHSEETDKSTLLDDLTESEDPKSEPKVKITPYPQTIGKDSAVEFSVDYDVTDGTTRIKVLALYMFYDSDKLQWNGLAKDGVLGLVDDPSSDSPAPSLIKGWSSLHGEFQNLDGWIDDDEDFTDGYDATDRMLYLRWRHNADQQLSTFRDEVSEKGFIGDNALPVELLKKVSFVRKPSFVSGTTTVRFKIEGISSGNVGADHGFTSTSVTITGSDSLAFENSDSSIVDENQPASGPVKVITEENNVTSVNAGNN